MGSAQATTLNADNAVANDELQTRIERLKEDLRDANDAIVHFRKEKDDKITELDKCLHEKNDKIDNLERGLRDAKDGTERLIIYKDDRIKNLEKNLLDAKDATKHLQEESNGRIKDLEGKLHDASILMERLTEEKDGQIKGLEEDLRATYVEIERFKEGENNILRRLSDAQREAEHLRRLLPTPEQDTLEDPLVDPPEGSPENTLWKASGEKRRELVMCFICHEHLHNPVSLVSVHPDSTLPSWAAKMRENKGCCHHFCGACVKLWLADHHTCPKCRRVVMSASDDPECRNIVEQFLEDYPEFRRDDIAELDQDYKIGDRVILDSHSELAFPIRSTTETDSGVPELGRESGRQDAGP
ncbi:hypothetical protein GP486_003318 [Trichoglossum hirsutum]|uniref:RING-type domain-containing protein n=1 Tax=Trichoglossum hirsutum TaxID=265104 RepID=A0A9P8LDH7_9PEZI|nr:hypothetical protein GP486_003318 [Trichoglossum hirsutum]